MPHDIWYIWCADIDAKSARHCKLSRYLFVDRDTYSNRFDRTFSSHTELPHPATLVATRGVSAALVQFLRNQVIIGIDSWNADFGYISSGWGTAKVGLWLLAWWLCCRPFVTDRLIVGLASHRGYVKLKTHPLAPFHAITVAVNNV